MKRFKLLIPLLCLFLYNFGTGQYRELYPHTYNAER